MSLIALIALGMLGLGLILFHALARWVSRDPGAVPAGRDLLLSGPLPGMALVAMLVTILSLLHLVRPWVMGPLAVLLAVLLRKDTAAVLGALKACAGAMLRAARGGDLFPLIALLLG